MTTQANINEAFLSNLDSRTFLTVMDNIAKHYGITEEEVLEEVCDTEAENIMDYITGDIRANVASLFNQFKKTMC
jgi:hypothetical protein